MSRGALAVLALAVTLAGCASGPPAPKVLNESRAGGAVDLVVGDSLLVRLETNPNTGYYWAWADSSGSLLQKTSEPIFERRTDAIGGGGTQIWRFRAVRSGEGTLRFVYRRPMSSDVAEHEVRYGVIVR